MGGGRSWEEGSRQAEWKAFDQLRNFGFETNQLPGLGIGDLKLV